MIYVTSDLHLGHNAILNMQNRPFENIDEMNEALIRNINQMVKGNDVLYILGDISYRITKEETAALVSRIKAKKYLIKGNHDRNNYDDLFDGVYDYLEVEHNHHTFSMIHYPLKSWKRMKYGGIQLHGHMHNTAKYNELNRINHIKQYDVGVDANEYYPVSLDYIIDFFNDDMLKYNDQHNQVCLPVVDFVKIGPIDFNNEFLGSSDNRGITYEFKDKDNKILEYEDIQYKRILYWYVDDVVDSDLVKIVVVIDED